MPDLIPQSLLMLPVYYHAEEYFTSQYFHQHYLADSPHGGKYRRHAHFVRTIRTMPLYTEYLADGHVVELAWDRVKSEANPNQVQWRSLFVATGYQPLTLLNATAQAELAHHLDNEANKQIAHAANVVIARQQGGAPLPTTRAKQELADWLDIGKLLGTPLYIVQQEAVKQVEASTGINLRPLLLGAPAQDHIPADEEMLEPTELAKLLHFPSAYALNKALAALGWQRRLAIGWEPIGDGIQHSVRHAWVSGGKSGLNWKWNIAAVRAALRPDYPRDNDGHSLTQDPGVRYGRARRRQG